MPEALQRLVFRAAFHARPAWFFAVAALLALGPALLRLLGRPSRIRRAAAHPLVVPAAVLLGVIAADAPPPARAQASRPNVLVIGVDSLRLDRLARPDVTPALGALLQDPGTVLFKNHWVGVPRTFPSWIEMLTGRYSAKTGIRDMFPGFGEREKPFSGLATALRDAGYDTAVVSDFAGDIFPRFEAGFAAVEAPKLTLKTMIRLSVDEGLAGFLPLMLTAPLRPLFPALKESPAFADAAHLESLAEARLTVGERPWLTTVFFSTAHFPYAAPHPYYARFADPGYAGPFRFEKNPEAGGDRGMGAADVAQVRALYDGAVRAVDDQLGRLFQTLKDRGLWDSTLIVVTADHGEDLYENGMLQGHGEHLRGENVLKVPLILKLPAGKTPAARTVERTTRSIDLAATLLAAVGLPESVGDGQDLLRPGAPELPAYAETGIWFARTGDGFFQKKRLDYPGIAGLLSFDQGYTGEIVLNPVYEQVVTTAKHRMLLDDGWKLIYMPTPHGIDYELYDQRHDPANLHDLARAEPARTARLEAKLLAFVAAAEAPASRLVDGFVVPN
jgi:arylsulfatase A-like enzyme